MEEREPVQDKIMHILMLEDNEHDAELIQMYLRNALINVDFTLVSDKETYIKALEERDFDVILSDHNLPQFNSLDALKIRNEKKFHIPFILVSGAIPEEYAVTILQAGANDYIIKDRPQRLVVAISEAIIKQRRLAEKILAEQHIIEANLKYRSLFDNPMHAFLLSNMEGTILDANDSACKLFGYTREEFLTLKRTDIIDVNHSLFVAAFESLKEKGIGGGEIDAIKKGGQHIPIDFVASVFLTSDEEKRISVLITDISNRKKLEENLAAEKLLREKENTEIAIRAQEQERALIGRELHDNISQLLANAKMMLDSARNSPQLLDTCLNRGYDAIALAINEVRNLSHSLVPPSFDDGNNFTEAINDLAKDAIFSGMLDVQVYIPTIDFKSIDNNIKLTFYRIIQEQLNNIFKYAKATHVSININVLKDALQLIITDNGIGFDTTQKHKGIGLRNMANRAESVSGTIHIISAPGDGCTVKIEVPFSEV